jgi:wyosine [tRNA(Phe)-imidazoG37] synthetase (radical SAM superfamily)
MKQTLSITDHSRDIAGLTYVYPVISRRAGGVSIGINVNTNNACNWRCVYCQVPELIKGAAPIMDFLLLEEELRFFLQQVMQGDFFDQFDVPEDMRVIKDVAISGNGEPTSVKDFDRLINVVGTVAVEMGVLPHCQFVLITNGSLIHQSSVQQGLRHFSDYQGDVWFKIDSATEAGRKKMNNSQQTTEKVLRNLKLSSGLCETSLQVCLLDYVDEAEALVEQRALIEWLATLKEQQVKIKKVMLYTLARPSLQPEAESLKKLSADKMEQFAKRIKDLDYFNVSISV